MTSSIPNAGFTPGPWQWVGDDEIEQVEHPFTSVAEVVRVPKDHDRAQQDANARLIAAAPELYEAVSELTDAMHRYEMDVDADAPAEHREMMRKAHAALAKARGEA